MTEGSRSGGAAPGEPGRDPAAASPAVAPPPGNPRFPLVDSLRAIAALSVLLFHVAGLTGALGNGFAGDVLAMLSRGLIVFFVVSGFLLYRPFVAARAAGSAAPDAGRYARRRALRIVPAYWLALAVLGIFPGIEGVFGPDWWRYWFFLQAYSADTFAGGIPVAWTLCVEVAFYVALPFWALAACRLSLRAELWALAALAAGGIVIQLLGARQVVSHEVSESLLGTCVWFALGMAFAVLSVQGAGAAVARLPGLCWGAAVAALAALALLLEPGGLFEIALATQTAQSIPRTLAAIVLTGVLAAGVVAPAIFGADRGGLPRRVLAWPPLAWLGLVSYGIYLWHLTIAELLILPAAPGQFDADGLDLLAHVDTLATPILALLTLAVTTAVAAASYHLVELPFLRRKERQRRRRVTTT